MTEVSPDATALVSVCILAGGRSRRFGSDKARAVFAGEPLIVRLAEASRRTGAPVFAVADVEGKYADLGVRTIADCTPGLGPLGGVEAALRAAPARGWVFAMSCDLLELRARWITCLQAHARPGRLAVAFQGEHWQPFPGLYHTDLLPQVQQRLAREERAMWKLLDAVEAVAVALPADWPCVMQVNTREELERARRLGDGKSG